jgi:hypothetical protein
MDQLDILKSKWNTQSTDYPVYSKKKLTGLLATKSSSIVKWLFWIAVAEFVILSAINFLVVDDGQHERYAASLGSWLYYGSTILSYAVVLFFIYRFWRNYKNISAEQPTRQLMKNILRTRRTMKQYIWFNLIYVMIFGVLSAVMLLFNDPQFAEVIQSPEFIEHRAMFTAGYITVMVLFFTIFCGLLYGIYSLIYGILLRRLKKNYQELKKMEI